MPLPTRRSSSASAPAPTGSRWDPVQQLDQLQDSLMQMLRGVWPDGENRVLDADAGWIPAVDVEEAEDAWIVEAELPGVDRDDVNVELRDSELAIYGEVKERERAGVLRRRTRRVGRFDFHVTLPGETDPEGIEATLREGVLTVRIPKQQRSEPHRIEVGRG
ncbi:MAG: heat shock protein Hsp20 [Conexibacter sp.]|jgi:HSP20 family protein|nr:heat shock protein Hsp20 [Conexibacter sp.]